MVPVAREMERRGLELPLADRRRDHLAAAHGRQDRARVQPRDRARARRLARRRRRLRPARPTPARRPRRREPRGPGTAARVHEEKQRKPLLPLAEARANRTSGCRTTIWPAPRSRARPVEPTVSGAARLRGLDVPLPRMGAEGPLSPPSSTTRSRRELYDDALALLATLGSRRRPRPAGIYAFWPACADDDDVVLDSGMRFHSFGSRRPGRLAPKPLSRRLRCARRRSRRRVRGRHLRDKYPRKHLANDSFY